MVKQKKCQSITRHFFHYMALKRRNLEYSKTHWKWTVQHQWISVENIVYNLDKDKVKNAVIKHIKSFKGRQSYYSMSKSSKVYLSEELNIIKMYQIFLEKAEGRASYETYPQMFSTHFNILFGYLKSDTCSSCDEFLAKIKLLQINIRRLEVNNKLHKVLQKKKLY